MCEPINEVISDLITSPCEQMRIFFPGIASVCTASTIRVFISMKLSPSGNLTWLGVDWMVFQSGFLARVDILEPDHWPYSISISSDLLESFVFRPTINGFKVSKQRSNGLEKTAANSISFRLSARWSASSLP